MTAADSDLDRMLRAHCRPTGLLTDQMAKCWRCRRILGACSTRPWSRKCVRCHAEKNRYSDFENRIISKPQRPPRLKIRECAGLFFFEAARCPTQ